MDHVPDISALIGIYYGNKDNPVYEMSAIYTFENISSSEKEIKAFPNFTHLMNLGRDQKLISEELMSFIN